MSTTVQPFLFAGQTVRPFGGGGGPVGFEVVGSGAVGSVAVFTAVVGTGVGSVTRAVVGVTNVEPLFDSSRTSVSTIAASAPANATKKSRIEIQIQSPGYQPRRRTQRRRSDETVPVVGGSRSPH